MSEQLPSSTSRPATPIPESTEVLRQLLAAVTQNQSLLAALYGPKDSKGESSVRLPDVPLFSGSREGSEEFLLKLENFFYGQAQKFNSESSKIAYIISRLDGLAFEWIKPILNDRLNPIKAQILSSTDAFVAEFRRVFSDPHQKEKATDRLLKLKQNKRSVLVYYTEFINLFHQSSMGKESARALFYHGLDQNLLKTMATRSFSADFDEFVKEVLDLDYNMSTVDLRDSLEGGAMPMDVGQFAKVDPPMAPDEWKRVKALFQEIKVCIFCMRHASHEDMDCPHRSQVTAMRLGNGNKGPISSYFLSLNPSLKLKVKFGSTFIEGLIDTGACGGLYMSQTTAKRLRLKTAVLDRPIPLRSFSGAASGYIRETTDSVKFLLDNIEYCNKFLILEECAAEILVGHDFLRDNELLVDCKNQRLLPASCNGCEMSHESSNIVASIPFARLKRHSRAAGAMSGIALITIPETQANKPHNFKDSISIIAMDEDEEVTIPEAYKDFKDVFDLFQEDKLPEYNESLAMELELQTGKEHASSCQYKLSSVEYKALQEEVRRGLATGKIRRSQARGACPVLFVKKPDGSLRMCIDYRRLNSITKKIHPSLPLVSDLLETVSGSSIYTKIDLKGAFNQLRMKKGSEHLTAFQTRMGTFEWL
jgi:hypothetical protein